MSMLCLILTVKCISCNFLSLILIIYIVQRRSFAVVENYRHFLHCSILTPAMLTLPLEVEWVLVF